MALGAFYCRLASRVGKVKAVIATARKIAVLFYNAMRYGMTYQDPGEEYYEHALLNNYTDESLNSVSSSKQYLTCVFLRKL